MFRQLFLMGAYSLTCVSCQSVAETPPKKLIPIVCSSKSSINLFGLEKLHPFDVKKYDKIYRGLEKDGFVTAESRFDPEVLTKEDLLLVHSEEYLNNLQNKELVARYLEAPILAKIPGLDVSKNVVQPFVIASGGTLTAARLALKHGAAVNIGGGYHHAMPNHGEGFCLIADVPITIRKLQNEGQIRTALIIDTDIHHGNGTVVCLANDPTTFTFSMHEENIYPWPKPKGDLDIVVPAAVSDAVFNAQLSKVLPTIFAKSSPDIVFHVAGCDALAGDPLANGNMTAAGIAKRDLLVYQFCKKQGVPYVMTLAGGYSKGAWKVQMDSIKGLMRDSDT